jgi:hypothetical protein
MDPTTLWKMLCEALHELEQSPDRFCQVVDHPSQPVT